MISTIARPNRCSSRPLRRETSCIVNVVVSGAIANRAHNAGEAWVRASWIEGFIELGHSVSFVEHLATSDDDPSHQPAIDWFELVVAWFGLADRSHLVSQTEPTEHVRGLLIAADVLIDISGTLPASWLGMVGGERVYVDLDPGFTQIWSERGLIDLSHHDRYATVGLRIGSPDCVVPTGGLEWIPVRQPVILDRWPVGPVPVDPFRCTTVASWRPSYGPLDWAGTQYGVKVHEFRRHLTLPGQTLAQMELALAIDPADAADRESLVRADWVLTDPTLPSASPAAFRDFVTASSTEWSVAQGAYVGLETGWFSDRTVRYLAAGRPAIVQETGWSRDLPSGMGLLSFDGVESAARAIAEVMDDPQSHGAAARAITEEWFCPARALAPLLERLGVRA